MFVRVHHRVVSGSPGSGISPSIASHADLVGTRWSGRVGRLAWGTPTPLAFLTPTPLTPSPLTTRRYTGVSTPRTWRSARRRPREDGKVRYALALP